MECIGNTGNRLIVDIDRRKPTVQLQRVLDLLDLLGLELVVRQKTAAERALPEGWPWRSSRSRGTRLHGSNIELQGPGNHLR